MKEETYTVSFVSYSGMEPDDNDKTPFFGKDALENARAYAHEARGSLGKCTAWVHGSEEISEDHSVSRERCEVCIEAILALPLGKVQKTLVSYARKIAVQQGHTALVKGLQAPEILVAKLNHKLKELQAAPDLLNCLHEIADVIYYSASLEELDPNGHYANQIEWPCKSLNGYFGTATLCVKLPIPTAEVTPRMRMIAAALKYFSRSNKCLSKEHELTLMGKVYARGLGRMKQTMTKQFPYRHVLLSCGHVVPWEDCQTYTHPMFSSDMLFSSDLEEETYSWRCNAYCPRCNEESSVVGYNPHDFPADLGIPLRHVLLSCGCVVPWEDTAPPLLFNLLPCRKHTTVDVLVKHHIIGFHKKDFTN
jgi:hypothetical protein